MAKRSDIGKEVIRIRGRNLDVPAAQVQGRKVIRIGRFLRIAKLLDEELVEGDPVSDPWSFVQQVRDSGLGADIFTFVQKPGAVALGAGLYREAESLAVVSTQSFKQWWDHLPQESRKNVRRAGKRGVVVKPVEFNDELVRGIKSIYDETPVRQGRGFWHHGKEFDAVKAENGTYLERSWFVGAFVGGELIGFIKVVMVDRIATIIQILAKNAHQDKRPMNALLAHTVELCERRGASLLVYGNYSYGNKGVDSLAEFKRRNGFIEVTASRYFMPLTVVGRMGLKFGWHRGVSSLLPRPILKAALNIRAHLRKTGILARSTTGPGRKERATGDSLDNGKPSEDKDSRESAPHR